jgi:hypothetical protein
MTCEAVLDGTVMLVDGACVSCNAEMRGRPARALILRRPTQFPETSERVWLLSRDSFSITHKLCRAKACRSFLDNPTLPTPPQNPEALFEDSIFYRGTARFLIGPVIERPWPLRQLSFFPDMRSSQMKRFLRDEPALRTFCECVDDRGLRCVGCWSSQEEIDAVHHYACLFAQETSSESGTWMPYWFRDARLVGTNRVAYLVKGATSYEGAVVMDTVKYQTLAWVWLTPEVRRRGIFQFVWKELEHYHGNFKVLAPISKSMRAFLNAKDPNGTHEIVTETGHD